MVIVRPVVKVVLYLNNVIIKPSTIVIVGVITLAVFLLLQVPRLRALHKRNLAEATKELAS